jgi:hypothetical protein
MRTVEINATQTLAEYVAEIADGPVIVTTKSSRGRGWHLLSHSLVSLVASNLLLELVNQPL